MTPRVPVYRFCVDDTFDGYNLMATATAQAGQTVVLEGNRFVVRSVVPLPERYRDRLGYEAYVFCQPAPAPRSQPTQ